MKHRFIPGPYTVGWAVATTLFMVVVTIVKVVAG